MMNHGPGPRLHGPHTSNPSLNMYRNAAQKPKLLPEDFLEKTFSEFLSCHPTYMIPLIRAHNFILRDLGPLNLITRHYIGIMAATRHRCAYLISFSKKEFLYNGGDPEWLKGLAHCPPKLRALNTINKVLAHQPWLFQKSHIESLTKGPNPWSLSELTHAIIIMAHFHALCSLAFGCKFGFGEPENFDEEDVEYEEVEIEELLFDANGSQKIKKIVKRSPASRLIIERCRQLEMENANLAEFMNFKINDKSKSNRSKANAVAKGVKNQAVKNAKGNGKAPKALSNNQSTNQVVAGPSGSSSGSNNTASNGGSSSDKLSNSPSCSSLASQVSTNQEPGPSSSSARPATANATTSASTSAASKATEGQENKKSDFKENTWSEDEWKKNNLDTFVEDAKFKYIDFASRGRPSEVSTFRFQDYQWDDQGYSLCNLLYPDIGPYLDEKFKVGYNLTYYTLGPKTNIDTSPFRRAIWNYIQCVYGMRHDDYNYREVNILLERHLKGFIKSLACYPENVVKQDMGEVMKGFRASEKVHVIIMVSEARLQTEMLYALRTVMEFMKQTT